MKTNPFELTFGLKPDNYISRLKQSEEIISSFEEGTNHIFMITGVRGTGKTVLLTHVAEHFESKNDWMVINLISEADMLDQLASRLYDSSLKHRIFDNKTFGFSFQGISFSISGSKPVTNVVSLIEILLQKIQKKKKVLICVDEALNNQYMKPFAQTFQLLLRNRYPINLLMTGLYQNIYELQNNESLTFLYRAPKINLEPLSISSIAAKYKEVFNVDVDTSIKLANLTKGYAYAYQVLGYLLFEKGNVIVDDALLATYDQYLQEYVYIKTFRELSHNDQQVLLAFNSDEKTKVEYLIKTTKMNKKAFSVYRDRLIKRGILYSPSYGLLSLKLPRFYDYLKVIKE